MKKTLVLLPIFAMLTACGTFSSKSEHEKINDRAREARIDNQRAVRKNAPDWYKTPPKADGGAYYEVATFSEPDMQGSINSATTLALGNICMTVAGEVSKVQKVTQTNHGNRSEGAVQARCNKVQVTGYVVEKKEGFEDNNGDWRSYVLIALPFGEANRLKQELLQEVNARAVTSKHDALQNELSRKN